MAGDLGENTCEEKVFNELFHTHSKDLYQFLYYKFGADNNPSDLVQDAFIKLWDNCARVPPDKARSFLFTVANNQMLNELSRKKTALKYSLEKHRGDTTQSPQYLMEEKEYMERLQAAINSLSEEQRAAFLLNRIEGKKHREIAEMLGISQKAVEKRIYSALASITEKVGKI
ncbi:MAG TPA: RNA polymerase sigma factor [Chryseosolibacter sp.]